MFLFFRSWWTWSDLSSITSLIRRAFKLKWTSEVPVCLTVHRDILSISYICDVVVDYYVFYQLVGVWFSWLLRCFVLLVLESRNVWCLMGGRIVRVRLRIIFWVISLVVFFSGFVTMSILLEIRQLELATWWTMCKRMASYWWWLLASCTSRLLCLSSISPSL